MNTDARFWGKVAQETGSDCWVWTGATRNGYGVIGIGRRLVYVHRWVYEDLSTDIPDGLVIDHLCANPDHLDPVTRAVNNERGDHSEVAA